MASASKIIDDENKLVAKLWKQRKQKGISKEDTLIIKGMIEHGVIHVNFDGKYIGEDKWYIEFWIEEKRMTPIMCGVFLRCGMRRLDGTVREDENNTIVASFVNDDYDDPWLRNGGKYKD